MRLPTWAVGSIKGVFKGEWELRYPCKPDIFQQTGGTIPVD